MQGNYFFADYAKRWIKRLTFDANGNVSGVFNFEPISGNPNESAGDIVYLTEGPDGALYYVDLGYSDLTQTFGVSKIRRIRYLQSNQAPVPIAAANPTSGAPPLAVNFSSAGSNDPEGQPITYSWDFGDGTSSTASNPVHTYTQAGQYVARLTVSDGVNSSISTPLTISVGSAPTATIDSPADGASFRAGDVISYGGQGTDAEDGNLPASAFSWSIDFLHDTHVAPDPAHHRGQVRHLHDPHQWSRLHGQHPLSPHADRDGFERAPGHEVGDGVPAEGEPAVRYRAQRTQPTRRRCRPSGSLRARHPHWLQPHDRGARPDRRRHHIHLRVRGPTAEREPHDHGAEHGSVLHRELQRGSGAPIGPAGRGASTKASGTTSRRRLGERQHRHPGERALTGRREVRERPELRRGQRLPDGARTRPRSTSRATR